jgi:hypothetical protein
MIWRDAVHADLPAIEKLWQEQQQRFHEMAPTVKSEMPVLFLPEGQTGPCGIFQPPILRVRVAERDGEIIASRVVEAVCEVQLIGGDQEVVNSLGKELPEECQWAKSRGFRSGLGSDPKGIGKAHRAKPAAHAFAASGNVVLIGCDFSELGD